MVQILFGVRFPWHVWLAVGLAATAAPLPLIPWRAGWRQASLAAAALSMAVQFVVVMTLVLPPVAECFSARDLAAYFNRAGQLPPRLWLAEQRVGSLVFYLDPQLRAGLTPGQVQPLVAGQPARLEAGNVVAVPKADRYHVVPRLDFGSAPCQHVGRYRLYTIRTPLVLPGQVEGERR